MKNHTSSSGLGLSSVLTIVFIVLKLVGVINWSWWWVLFPTLIEIGLVIVILIIYVICVTCEIKKDDTFYVKKGKNNKWKF